MPKNLKFKVEFRLVLLCFPGWAVNIFFHLLLMITLLFKDCAQILHCKCFLSETVLFASVQPLQCLQTTKYLRSGAAEGHCRSSVVWRLPHGVTEDADTELLHVSSKKDTFFGVLSTEVGLRIKPFSTKVLKAWTTTNLSYLLTLSPPQHFI